MLSCRLASGKRFKRWITSEVLPTIRKNGFYITDPLLQQFAQTEIFLPEGGIGTQHFLHDSFGTVAVCRLRQIFPFRRQHQKRTGKHPHF